MQPNVGTKRIILVDDDNRTLRLADGTRSGRTISATPHASRALEWLKSDPAIVAILVEEHLRAMPGIQLLHQARAIRPGVHRVILSSFKSLAEIVSGLHSGVIHRIVPSPLSASDVQNLFETTATVAA